MQIFDYEALKRGFNRTAKTYQTEAQLSELTGDALLQRLSELKITPERILDIGAGSGCLSRKLSKLYPKARIFSVDLAEKRLLVARGKRKWFRKQHFICADAHALPFKDKSFDLIVSNLCWYWMDHLNQAIYEAKRVLNTNGSLLFSTLGPDSLRELRASFQSASPNPHVNIFLDMHDLGDALLKAGFSDPVMDVEHICKTFKKLDQLFLMLKKTGELNYMKMRGRGLFGKTMLKTVRAHYESYKIEKTYPATFEIVYGYAWRKHTAPAAFNETEISVPIENIQRKF